MSVFFDLQNFAEGADGGAAAPEQGAGGGDGQGASVAPEAGGGGGGQGAPAPAAGAAGGANGSTAADGTKPGGGTILGGTGKDGAAAQGGGGSPAGVPDVYDFKAVVPDGMDYDEKAAAAFGAVARKAGLSQEQAGAVAAYGLRYMQEGVDAAMQAVLETQSAWADAARTELGGQFEATVARAAAARDALSTKVPGLSAMLNETGAGNRIEMIRLMAAVGELIGEDGGVRGGNAGQEKSIYPNTDFSRY